MAIGPNETVLREIYDRYAKGDADYLFSKLSNDIVWKSSGNPDVLPTAGVRRGHAGVREFFAKLQPDWDIQKHDMLEVIAQGDSRFAVRVAVAGIHRRTKGRAQFEKVDLVTMKDGKCISYEEVLDTATLERAAGHGSE